MTSNQIAFLKQKEEHRANVAKEAENIREANLVYETNRRAQELQHHVAHLNADTELNKANITRATEIQKAQLNAETQRYVADQNRKTQLEVAAINSDTSRYVVGVQADTSRYNATLNYQASTYATDVNWGNTRAQLSEDKRHNIAMEGIDTRRNTYTGVNNVINAVVGAAKVMLPFLV